MTHASDANAGELPNACKSLTTKLLESYKMGSFDARATGVSYDNSDENKIKFWDKRSSVAVFSKKGAEQKDDSFTFEVCQGTSCSVDVFKRDCALANRVSSTYHQLEAGVKTPKSYDIKVCANSKTLPWPCTHFWLLQNWNDTVATAPVNETSRPASPSVAPVRR